MTKVHGMQALASCCLLVVCKEIQITNNTQIVVGYSSYPRRGKDFPPLFVKHSIFYFPCWA